MRALLLTGTLLAQPLLAAGFSSYRIHADSSSVPSSAVIQRNGIPGVFIFHNGLARFVMVKPGKRHPRRIEILSGLLPGDQIILGPTTTLHDGSPITLNP